MRILVGSDIHGSAYYCKKLLEAVDLEKADRILLLGDILYHGPRNDLPKDYDPKAVIAMLNERKKDIFCVRGNCDTEVDQMVLEFPILADYAVFVIKNHTLYATHGHKFAPKALPLQKGDIYLQGHTHVPKWELMDDIYWMNPGSVSIPKESSHHQYMVIDTEEGSFLWKDFAGLLIKKIVIE